LSADKDAALLDDLLEHAEEAMRYLDGVGVSAFRKDRRLRLAIERLLEIVGEAAGGLSEEARASIPFDWRAVRGLRNVIAHQYGAIDPDQLHRVVRARLPALVAAIRKAR
jgi:uncharacterized protein with HEPN domain